VDMMRRTAVVADELALVRLGLASVLGEVGVDVVAETPGGREAAELLRLHDAEVVVIGAPSDMPVAAAVRRARASGAAAKIIALLGAGQIGTVAAVVEAGADGVTLRGAATVDLVAAMGEVLAGRRHVSAVLSSGLVGQLESVVAPESGNDLLTYREREVLALLAGGATNREIASTLSVTIATVKSHLVHVYAKLEVRNRQEALSRAVGLGLLV
jgi:DNA-binding NarL/FixJ family response regulator